MLTSTYFLVVFDHPLQCFLSLPFISLQKFGSHNWWLLFSWFHYSLVFACWLEQLLWQIRNMCAFVFHTFRKSNCVTNILANFSVNHDAYYWWSKIPSCAASAYIHNPSAFTKYRLRWFLSYFLFVSVVDFFIPLLYYLLCFFFHLRDLALYYPHLYFCFYLNKIVRMIGERYHPILKKKMISV